MLDLPPLYDFLEAEGFEGWPARLDTLLRERNSPRAHGKLNDWLSAIDGLPPVEPIRGCLDAAAIGAPGLILDPREAAAARTALRALLPWRKGPFRIGDILIDTEWRSDLKWDRVCEAVSPLHDRRVLDVGCGNGYYALRMRGAGARCVIGLDPTLIFLAQFRAILHFIRAEPVHVLPIRLEEMPAVTSGFDTAFSMGVLYHSRAPIEHLRLIRDALRPGGELVLETIVLPGDSALSRTPAERYARMRNVWHLPSLPELLIWLERSGFRNANVVDVNLTTTQEQRTTDWMPFESLAEALDPDDPARTVEGWPAPRRAVVTASVPGQAQAQPRPASPRGT